MKSLAVNLLNSFSRPFAGTIFLYIIQHLLLNIDIQYEPLKLKCVQQNGKTQWFCSKIVQNARYRTNSIYESELLCFTQ